MYSLEDLKRRDGIAARSIKAMAQARSSEAVRAITPVAGAKNTADVERRLAMARDAVAELAEDPFHAVIEFQQTDRRGNSSKKLCYINLRTSSNEAIGDYMVMRWTNDIAQVALSKPFGERSSANGTFVIPEMRGVFSATIPEIVGEYSGPDGVLVDPSLSQLEPTTSSRSLRSIKLGMTGEQVDAFIGRAEGYMLIQGAPGTGKTTVGLQRIRYILDLGDEADTRPPISHSPETTAVFVPTQAVVSHIQLLLQDLDLTNNLVENIQEHLRTFVALKWKNNLNALYVEDAFDHRDRDGRRAFYGLCTAADLEGLWECYEAQILARLRTAERAPWFNKVAEPVRSEIARIDALINTLSPADDDVVPGDAPDDGADVEAVLERSADETDASYTKRLKRRRLSLRGRLRKFIEAMVPDDNVPKRHPRLSRVRFDELFARCAPHYTTFLNLLPEESNRDSAIRARNKLTEEIVGWLWWVYDPLAAIARYFSGEMELGFQRVRSGLGDEIAARKICESIRTELSAIVELEELAPRPQSGRTYRSEQTDWIAWLLQSILPTAANNPKPLLAINVQVPADPNDPYKTERWDAVPLVPFAHLSGHRTRSDSPWHHVVVDEAQDLSAASAAFIAASVHRRGALTVAADFHQTVSPTQGLIDDEAVRFGTMLEMKSVPDEQRFKRNMRQTAAIGSFLQQAFLALFGQHAPFEPNDAGQPGNKPVLVERPTDYFAALRVAVEELKAKGARSIVIATIDEDRVEALKLVERYADAISFDHYLTMTHQDSELIITRAEDIKGFEFDACIILGVDRAEKRGVKFFKERTYVALSRAMQHLWIITDTASDLMQQIPGQYFEARDL